MQWIPPDISGCFPIFLQKMIEDACHHSIENRKNEYDLLLCIYFPYIVIHPMTCVCSCTLWSSRKRNSKHSGCMFLLDLINNYIHTTCSMPIQYHLARPHLAYLALTGRGPPSVLQVDPYGPREFHQFDPPHPSRKEKTPAGSAENNPRKWKGKSFEANLHFWGVSMDDSYSFRCFFRWVRSSILKTPCTLKLGSQAGGSIDPCTFGNECRGHRCASWCASANYELWVVFWGQMQHLGRWVVLKLLLSSLW